MKLLGNKNMKIKKKLLSKRGESIMEVVVSLLIMGLLLTSIMSIIRYSMAMTGNVLSNARIVQNEVNKFIHDNDNSIFFTGTERIRFTGRINALTTPATPITPFIAAHDVDLAAENDLIPNIIAFRPAVTAGGGP